MENSIPKIIHYCWFGGKMPTKIRININKWKSILSDYTFMEWNEKNLNLSDCNFAKEAYENKKWAFVSDYARLYALYNYGGIYLDTDVEVIKKFDDLLNKGEKLIISHESKKSLCTAVIISNKGNNLIGGFLNQYKNKKFIDDGKMQMRPNSELILEYFDSIYNSIEYDNEYNSNDLKVLPQTYLCGKDIFNYKLLITENTYCIHQLDASWYSPGHKFLKKCKKVVRGILNKF